MNDTAAAGPSGADSVYSSRVNRTASYNQSLSDITAYATALSAGVSAVYGKRSSQDLAFDAGLLNEVNGGSNKEAGDAGYSSSSRLAGEKRKSRWDTTDQN